MCNVCLGYVVSNLQHNILLFDKTLEIEEICY